jgi:hypothetical protein
MALLGNRSVFHKSVAKYVTGAVLASDPPNWNKQGALRNWGKQTGLDWTLSAIPQGHTSGWKLPLKSGGMSARNTVLITTSQSIAAVAEKPAAVGITLTLSQALDAYRVSQAAASITLSLMQTFSAVGLAYSNLTASLSLSVVADINASLAAQMNAYLALTETLDATLAAPMNSDATLTFSSEAYALGTAYAEAQFLLSTSETIAALATKLMHANLQVSTAETFDLEATTAVGVLAQLSLVANASAYGIGYMQSSTVAASETPSASAIAAEVWAYVNRTLTAGGGSGGGLSVEQETWLRELYQKEGLDADYPVTVDKAQNKIFIGNPLSPLFVIDMSGDFRVTTTLERQL